MLIRSFVAALVVVSAFLSSACVAHVGSDLASDLKRYDAIQIGVSTKADVHRAFGQPHDVGHAPTSPTATLWLYFDGRVSVSPLALIPYAGFVVGGSDTDLQVATFTFDPDSIVSKVERLAESHYMNNWEGISTLILPDDAGERVRAEMNSLRLPFDAEVALSVKGMDDIRD